MTKRPGSCVMSFGARLARELATPEGEVRAPWWRPGRLGPATAALRRMPDDGLLEAVRGLHLAHPELGPKPQLAKLRAQQPELAAGNKEVREARAVGSVPGAQTRYPRLSW